MPSFVCPSCWQTLKATEAQISSTVRCPRCKEEIAVPAKTTLGTISWKGAAIGLIVLGGLGLFFCSVGFVCCRDGGTWQGTLGSPAYGYSTVSGPGGSWRADACRPLWAAWVIIGGGMVLVGLHVLHGESMARRQKKDMENPLPTSPNDGYNRTKD